MPKLYEFLSARVTKKFVVFYRGVLFLGAYYGFSIVTVKFGTVTRV